MAERTLFQRYLAYYTTCHEPLTVLRAASALNKWENFLRADGQEPEEATREDVEAYMLDLREAPSTRHHTIGTLKLFHEWLCDQGFASSNPWRNVRGPRIPKRLPRTFSDVEMARFERAVSGHSTRDLRDRALISLLRASGCRIGEALALDLSDVQLETQSAIVYGKGLKERIVFFDDRATKALRRWILGARPRWARTTKALFVGQHGRRMRYDIARDRLIAAAERAGVSKRVTLHMFRHTFATDLHDRGVDIRDIQELLGHEKLSTTQIYTHVSAQRLQRIYRRAFSPPEGAS